jgi:ankyrin repeat protein
MYVLIMVNQIACKYVIRPISSFFSFLVPILIFCLCLMQELLMAGADPNAVDGEGESILHIAVARKYTDCAVVILEHGGCRSMGIPNSEHKT